MAIEFYKEFGELGYLANYSNHSFIKNGVLYKTVEHYYQSEKYNDESIRQKIIAAPTPKEASRIGRDRNNIRRPHFKEIKNQVMYEGILEKFRQNRDIAYKLIETRNEEIAEATINEYYWGIGQDRTGENHIGAIIARVRKEIKKEILNSILTKSAALDTVYVIGHRNSDADSIFSSYLLAKILKSLHINAVFAVLDQKDDYCNSDAKLIHDMLPVEPTVVSSTSNHFILVDHNNLDGLNKDQVIGAIDHHIITGEVYDTLEIEYSSTCLLIYDLFKDLYEFTEEDKTLIYMTVLADTEYLCSHSRYKKDDQDLVEELGITLDVPSLQKKYFVTNDFSLSIEDNLKSNYKEYNREGHHIKRSLIYSYTEDFEKYYSTYISHLKEDWLLIWCDFQSQKTYVYYNNLSFVYDYIITSTNVILKNIFTNNLPSSNNFHSNLTK